MAVVPLGRGGPALALLKLNSLRPWDARRRRSSLTTAGQAPISNPLGYRYMALRARPLDRCWASALRCLIRYGKGRGIARAPKPAGLPAITLLLTTAPGRYQYAGRRPLRAAAAVCRTLNLLPTGGAAL